MHQMQTSSSHHHDHLLNLLNQCTSISNLKQIHTQLIRTTQPHHPKYLLLHSKLLHFTSAMDIDYSFKVFNQIINPNSFIWNTLIRGCARSTTPNKELVFKLYIDMLIDGVVLPDKHTYPFVLKGLAYLFDEFGGKQVHNHILKHGFGSDVYVNNSLIHFYASCGLLSDARKVFDEMPERNLVSWNVMIDGFVQLGRFDLGLRLFCLMQELFEPDGYTLQSVISACAALGALSSGIWVHGYVLRRCGGDLSIDVLVNNALIDMYCKFGMLELAKQVFDRMSKRDVNSWNSIILGLAMHGFVTLAIEHFDEMIKVERLRPNSITFVGILSACNHGGMVELGHEYFDKMVKIYSIEPQLEHYGCLVDLLARAGLIEDALDLVSNMPMKPDAVIWRSLLDACCKRNVGIELSEEVAKMMLESKEVTPNSSGAYVLLSKVYASANRWNDVGLIRKMMIDKGIKKEPGCTTIEVDGVNHEFFAGDTSHPQRNNIYRVLDSINERLTEVGYKPDLSQASLDDEEEDVGIKQNALKVHSERLAIAFGLLHLKPGVPIRIFKNLRVCNDCHEVTKLISKVFDVEIVVRDRVRFHHFKDGSCSCSDYW